MSLTCDFRLQQEVHKYLALRQTSQVIVIIVLLMAFLLSLSLSVLRKLQSEVFSW